ncbi:MAG: DUF2795 domain-containing protein [Micromonosporaceae bacterium]
MPIERGSTTHGPNLDEQMKHEVQGRVQGQESPRAEEWHEPEPAGEDQPEPDRLPDGHTAPGTPAGMTSEDVEGRSELARYLPHQTFPAERERLLTVATEHQAPDDVLGQLRELPADDTYQNVTQVWAALGHGTEDASHRP